jgi:hypothetical protein
MGRPSSYTDEIAEDICDGLREGLSLVDVCADDKMPDRRTVYRWMDENEAFATRIARAREGQAEYMDHLVLQTARNCTPESAPADRVKIAAFQWRAAKLKPKAFGDRVTQHVVGKDDDSPVEVASVSNRDRAKAMALLARKVTVE